MDTEAPLSTTIDTDPGPSAAGGGVPNLSEPADTKADQPASLRDDIEAVFKEESAKDDAKPEKPKDEKALEDKAPEPKPEDKAKAEPEAKPAEKPEAKDGKAPEPKADADDAKPDDKGKVTEPPKNFLPDSREVWRNVPRAVRRDIDTMVREHETAVQQYREAGQRYEAIKPFDDLARSNGRDLRESLSRVVEFENLLASNPIAGLNRILMEAGPRKADGQPISLYEVADFIVKQGQQGYQQMVARVPQQQEQGPSEVDKLKEELEALKAEMTTKPIIERFASRNPRYYELQDDVAFFLQSGKIPASLSPEEKLAAAYDMAVRINPASNVANAPANDGPAPDRRADEGFSGSKSIKSSPGSVDEDVEDQAKGGESIRDSILKAARRLNA